MSGYNFNNNLTVTENTKKWMMFVDDNIKINQMSLPGTHDTMTYTVDNSNISAKTQVSSLRQQLDSGIRVLDIRCKPCNNDFIIYHGIVNLGMNFKTVLDTVVSFLNDSSSETVLMNVQQEGDSCDNSEFKNIWKRYWNQYKNYFYQNSNYNQNPTLKEIRKKILVLQNFTLNQEIYGILKNYCSIQNDYSINTNWDVQNKWSKIKAHLDKTIKNGDGNKLYINYLSASSPVGLIAPYFIASGKSSPNNGDPQLFTGIIALTNSDEKYRYFTKNNCAGNLCSLFFTGINNLFHLTIRPLKDMKTEKIGIIMIDFPSDNLIKEIININNIKMYYWSCDNKGFVNVWWSKEAGAAKWACNTWVPQCKKTCQNVKLIKYSNKPI